MLERYIPMPRSDADHALTQDPPPVLADRVVFTAAVLIRRPISRIAGSTGRARRSRCRSVGRASRSEDQRRDDEPTQSAAGRRLATRPRRPRPAGNDRAARYHRPSKALHVARILLAVFACDVSSECDSDEATLDAIAASGKPLTLPEAIDLAFRSQPRLRAQLESIAQARGQQQIAFSTFLPIVAGNYDVGGFGLGSRGRTHSAVEGPPGIQLHTRRRGRARRPEPRDDLRAGRAEGPMAAPRLRPSAGPVRAGASSRVDIARLQTERAYQTVANEVAVAYYNVLRSQALRRTAQDALRRAEEELADARKRQREGVIERERSCGPRCRRAEIRQQLHAATEAEFVALAGLNLAIGLEVQSSRSASSSRRRSRRWRPRWPIACRRPSGSAASSTSSSRTVEIAAQGGRVARAEFAPKVIADGTMLNFQQQELNGHADLRLGFIRLDWTLFEGGRRIAAARVADSQVRQAMAQAESIADNIAFQVNEAYRNAVTARLGIDDARPAVDQASENYRLVQLRLREGAATPTEIADAQASLTRAQQNYLNARYGYLIAMDRLDYAMGVGQTPMTPATRASLARTKSKHAEHPMSCHSSRPRPPPNSPTQAAAADPAGLRRPIAEAVPSGPSPRAGRVLVAHRRRPAARR